MKTQEKLYDGTLIFPGQINKVQTRVDKTIMIQLITPEFRDESSGFLMGLNQKMVGVVIQRGQIVAEDYKLQLDKPVADTSTPIKKQPTPSQRMRNAIWDNWRKEGFPGGDNAEAFDAYYVQQIDNLIGFIKIQHG